MPEASWSHPRTPSSAALHDARLWEVPVRARYSDPQLFEWLAQALRQLPARR